MINIIPYTGNLLSSLDMRHVVINSTVPGKLSQPEIDGSYLR